MGRTRDYWGPGPIDGIVWRNFLHPSAPSHTDQRRVGDGLGPGTLERGPTNVLENLDRPNLAWLGTLDSVAPYKPVPLVEGWVAEAGRAVTDNPIPCEVLRDLFRECLPPPGGIAAMYGSRLEASRAGDDLLVFSPCGQAGELLQLSVLRERTAGSGLAGIGSARSRVSGQEIQSLHVAPKTALGGSAAAGEALIGVRTLSWLCLLWAKSPEQNDGLGWEMCTAGALQAESQIADVAWNRILPGEVAFVCTDGSLYLSDLATAGQSARSGAGGALFPRMQAMRVGDGLAEAAAPVGLAAGRRLCEWTPHPRIALMTAGRDLLRCDLRGRPGTCARTTVHQLEQGDAFHALATPTNGAGTVAEHLVAAAARHTILLFDTRRFGTPLITWTHGSDCQTPNHIRILTRAETVRRPAAIPNDPSGHAPFYSPSDGQAGRESETSPQLPDRFRGLHAVPGATGHGEGSGQEKTILPPYVAGRRGLNPSPGVTRLAETSFGFTVGRPPLIAPRLPITGSNKGKLDPGKGFEAHFEGQFGSQSDSQHPSQLPAGFLEDFEPWGAGGNPATQAPMQGPMHPTLPVDGRIVAASWADGVVSTYQFRLGGGAARLEVVPNLYAGPRSDRRGGIDAACHLRATAVGKPEGEGEGGGRGEAGLEKDQGGGSQRRGGGVGRGESEGPSGNGHEEGDVRHSMGNTEGLCRPLFSWVPHLSLAPIGIQPQRRVCQPLGASGEVPGEEEPRRSWEKHMTKGLPDLQGFALLPSGPKPTVPNPTKLPALWEDPDDPETLPDADQSADPERAGLENHPHWHLLRSNALGDVMVTPVALFAEDAGGGDPAGGVEYPEGCQDQGFRERGPLRRIHIGLPSDACYTVPVIGEAGDVGATSDSGSGGHATHVDESDEHASHLDELDVHTEPDTHERQAADRKHASRQRYKARRRARQEAERVMDMHHHFRCLTTAMACAGDILESGGGLEAEARPPVTVPGIAAGRTRGHARQAGKAVHAPAEAAPDTEPADQGTWTDEQERALTNILSNLRVPQTLTEVGWEMGNLLEGWRLQLGRVKPPLRRATALSSGAVPFQAPNKKNATKQRNCVDDAGIGDALLLVHCRARAAIPTQVESLRQNLPQALCMTDRRGPGPPLCEVKERLVPLAGITRAAVLRRDLQTLCVDAHDRDGDRMIDTGGFASQETTVRGPMMLEEDATSNTLSGPPPLLPLARMHGGGTVVVGSARGEQGRGWRPETTPADVSLCIALWPQVSASAQARLSALESRWNERRPATPT